MRFMWCNLAVSADLTKYSERYIHNPAQDFIIFFFNFSYKTVLICNNFNWSIKIRRILNRNRSATMMIMKNVSKNDLNIFHKFCSFPSRLKKDYKRNVVFQYLCCYICSRKVYVKSIYNIYISPTHENITHKIALLLHIIVCCESFDMGNKINP